MVFCTFWNKSAQFLSISKRNYHSLSAKLKKPCVFVCFRGARSNRSNPISYSFYLIGLLWSGDLEKHPNCKTVSRLDLVCLCPKWKTLVVLNLPCNAAHCTAWRGIILICGQTLSQKFKTSWKRIVFYTFWRKSAQFLSVSQRIYHTLSAKLKKPCVFAIFPGLVQKKQFLALDLEKPIASIRSRALR